MSYTTGYEVSSCSRKILPKNYYNIIKFSNFYGITCSNGGSKKGGYFKINKLKLGILNLKIILNMLKSKFFILTKILNNYVKLEKKLK